MSSKDTLCILVRCQWFDKMAVFHILGMIYGDRKTAKVNSVLATLFLYGKFLLKCDLVTENGESPVCFCLSESVFCFLAERGGKIKETL